MTNYYITDSNLSTNLASLKTVIEPISTEYFDKITLSGDNLTLDFYTGEHKLLSISVIDNKYLKVDLHGDNCTATQYPGGYMSAKYKTYIRLVTKTKTGIALAINCNGWGAPHGLFITKTNKITVGVALYTAMCQVIGNSYEQYVYCVNKKSINADPVFMINASKDNIVSQPLTTAYPLVVSGTEDYMSNLFAVPTCPYKGVSSVLTIKGVNYLYNGYIALKDE